MNCAKFKIKTHSHKIKVKNEMRRYHEYLVFICVYDGAFDVAQIAVQQRMAYQEKEKEKVTNFA